VYRTNIYLEAEQMRALKHLAAEDNSSVAELVRQAVDRYIAERLSDDTAWREQLDAFLARVRAGLPSDVPGDVVEADISAARQEVRLARDASRGH
jgi:hypothetical protein